MREMAPINVLESWNLIDVTSIELCICCRDSNMRCFNIYLHSIFSKALRNKASCHIERSLKKMIISISM